MSVFVVPSPANACLFGFPELVWSFLSSSPRVFPVGSHREPKVCLNLERLDSANFLELSRECTDVGFYLSESMPTPCLRNLLPSESLLFGRDWFRGGHTLAELETNNQCLRQTKDVGYKTLEA